MRNKAPVHGAFVRTVSILCVPLVMLCLLVHSPRLLSSAAQAVSGIENENESGAETKALPNSGRVYYFDSDTGSDSSSGLSESEAFASVGALGSLSLAPGDKVLFKCGCVFTGTASIMASGTADRHITFGSYGEGSAPILTNNAAGIAVTVTDSAWLDFSGFDITAPAAGGRGMYLFASGADCHDITLRDIRFHDISNHNSGRYLSSSKASLFFQSSGAPGISVHDITVTGCEFCDCSYGISGDGARYTTGGYVRNHDITVTGCSFHDIWDDAVIIICFDRFTVRDCSVIDTCISTVYYTAPVWMACCDSCVVDSCEFAGTLNYMDGMTVDFDEQTTNSTYERIYSHDNIHFLWGVARQVGNIGNTVRYCLSVNDNVSMNGAYITPGTSYTLDGLKFYNNTLYNCSSYYFWNYPGAVVKNNIFCFSDGSKMNIRPGSDFSNNLYQNFQPPADDSVSSFAADPLFCDPGNTASKDSFMLAEGSPALGAGTQVEKDMGLTDLWGNVLNAGMTHNIGCYEGAGVKRIVPVTTVTTTVPAGHTTPPDTTAAGSAGTTRSVTVSGTSSLPSSSSSSSSVSSPSSSSQLPSSSEFSLSSVSSASTAGDTSGSGGTGTSGNGEISFIPGDVDGDGFVTAADARLALRIAIWLDMTDDVRARRASDVDRDRAITAADARIILRTAIGLQKINN